jgi:NAD(P)-dependent dehydrogenase (short-subunit alcohol dehydrogenase family)
LGDYLNRFSLTNRVAVVTGASEGIGEAIALGLAEAGADVIVCSRREEKLKQVKAEAEKMGRKAEVFVLDVCKLRDIEKLRDFILKRFGKVDILINNAAFTVTKPAWDVTEDEWNLMIDTGFKGLFFCCQTIGSIMRQHKYGKIITLALPLAAVLLKAGQYTAPSKPGFRISRKHSPSNGHPTG